MNLNDVIDIGKKNNLKQKKKPAENTKRKATNARNALLQTKEN